MAQLLKAKQHDIGGLFVKRVLPNAKKRMVGPFIFFDEMGPGGFDAGHGINVRPHPHIGLSTLTYLFEGSILHRDSLGNRLEISPGDVNWMTAGRGIVHSERESLEVRASKHSIHGLQSWIALPKELAEIEPSFTHIKKQDLPEHIDQQVMARLIVGEAYGMSSPVKTYSPMFYIDVVAGAGSEVERPNPAQEAALYVISGQVQLGEGVYESGEVVMFDDEQVLVALTNARFVLFGGEQWQEIPHIHWNFVSFSKARIEQAREDWQAGRFPAIPGDDKEFIPLP
ncbi:pirin family protein [Salinibius halmophilus]|uniref:pirin family protein n=1 Tax=Salinibius halmophilus TaxID=1853216 RepID=UPI000E6669A1|nr:pirin family protein [Salinibius halmophilus]